MAFLWSIIGIFFSIRSILTMLPLTGLLAVGAYGYGYWKGKAAAEAACQVAALQAEVAELRQERATQIAADAEEDAALAALDAENTELERKLEDYRDEIAKRPDKCAVTDDDLRRMQ